MGMDEGVVRVGTSGALRCLTRRKQVDSETTRAKEDQGQLAKALSIPGLVAIGVGATIGAGVYVLVGTVARDHSGAALTVSFLIAGISAALSAICYAELASRCPSAGSAYHYSYICVGEGVAWMIAWALILEYTIGGSAVARGISPNLALFFGGPDSLPAFLSRVEIPWLGVVVDPCAAILVLVVTVLLSVGIKESSLVQGIITAVNVCVMIFVIVLGTYLGFKSGWPGYHITSGYFPFGINGVIAGSATVFFSYIGFDSVASAAEEVKEPQRDLPLGIGLSLSICCGLYMLVSAVIVGLVPYFDMDPDTPISSAFASLGVEWAMYFVSAGAFTALCATLMGSLLPQPRILMAMARDGLLPSFFSDVNRKTQVPVKGTIASGVCAAILAFLMNIEELAGMVSVGTLLSFTIVAISILILRYIPPDEVPLPSSLQESIHSVASRYNSEQNLVENREDRLDSMNVENPQSIPLIASENTKEREQRRRKVAAISIAYACVGSLILTSALSAQHLPQSVQTPLYIGGGLLVLGSLGALYAIDQDDNRHNFGHSGGFTCPFVPLLPICCILINVYLLINLGASTWWKVALWLALGIVIYVFYGRKHSQLVDAVYVPSAHVEEIYRTSLEICRTPSEVS